MIVIRLTFTEESTLFVNEEEIDDFVTVCKLEDMIEKNKR